MQFKSMIILLVMMTLVIAGILYISKGFIDDVQQTQQQRYEKLEQIIR